MGKKILVVVDYQYDFFNPDGALYVKGGEKLYDKILKIIPNFDGTVFTQDWHPLDHCSFKDNGGTWPIHCVQGSIGAGIPVEMLKAAKEFVIYEKGTDPDVEEYGAFDYGKKARKLIDVVSYCMFRDSKLKDKDIESIVICGIAGDYCVCETIDQILLWDNECSDKISIYLDGIVSIDGGEKLNNFIKENNIKIYD